MRHIQLIAISGSIGSALFISIGIPLTSAGPLGLLIGMALWCTVVFASANCLTEMTTLLPLDGGFLQFATRFVDESFGMALGWNVRSFVLFSVLDSDTLDSTSSPSSPLCATTSLRST